jgi:curved DNA-binding protein
MTDHYATLGVSRTASADEIKQAFRRLASKNHPDKGGDTAKFHTLGNAEKRAMYDNPRPQFSGGQSPFDINNIFNMFAQGSGFHGGGQQGRRNHVRMSLCISLADAIRGGPKTVAVATNSGSTTVQIDVPAGIDTGDNVQYGGIAPGGLDLIIQFHVMPDSTWRRDGVNLHADHKVSVWDLILGGDIEITTAQGRTLAFSVSPRTQPGTVIRLRSQGIHARSGEKGDLLIRLQALLPTDISDSILDAIRAQRG